MDIWDDEENDHVGQVKYAEREWTRIEESFINDGYREGITAGKESALQEGFDEGFTTVGVPLGKRVGSLRGVAAGLLAFLRGTRPSRTTSSESQDPSSSFSFAEAQAIVRGLDQIRFADIVPVDEQAEEHSKLHEDADIEITEDQGGDGDDGMDDISSAFATLATRDSAARRRQRREEALAELQRLELRLSALLQQLNIHVQL